MQLGNLVLAQSPLVADRSCDDCDRCHSSHVQVEQGQRRPVIDGIGWLIGVPRKIFLWDSRANNHAVSNSTVCEVTTYLEYRGLTDTKVRVNQYAPADEWRRLANNREIGSGWKYTAGSLQWLQYTLIPGRLFGNDEYNPFTNMVNLYSDMPTMGLAAAAYAKDVSECDRPGTYAFVQGIPVVSLWHETLATDEVIQYVSIHGSSEQIEKVRHDLYARYGIETTGAIGQFLPDGTGLFQVVGAIGGHAVAAQQNAQQRR